MLGSVAVFVLQDSNTPLLPANFASQGMKLAGNGDFKSAGFILLSFFFFLTKKRVSEKPISLVEEGFSGA